MTGQELTALIKSKGSYLCVGLDTDPARIPAHLQQEANPVLAFNKAIIDATAPYAVAYKINSAFYEAQGAAGWQTMQDTIQHIGANHFIIADAKRGDIGNTSRAYAQAFFEHLGAHALTVAPYMGHDSVLPFLEYKNHWVILLALTSNPGSADFQQLPLAQQSQQALFEQVLQTAATWAGPEQLMFVVGATQTHALQRVRQLVPQHFLLVPGVGAQGGSLEQVSKLGLNAQGGLLVNASRSIIYAGSGPDFAHQAAAAAQELQGQMATYLQQYAGA